MAVTLQSADNALKSVYLDVVSEQLNTNINPFFAAIKHSTEDVWGKDVIKLATYGVNGGVGAGTEDGALPKAAGNNYRKFVSTLKNLYGVIEISDKAVRASANNEGAFVNLLNAEMEGLVKASKYNFSRMLFGDGTGVVGQVMSAAGNTVLLYDEPVGLVPGMIIDIYSDGQIIESASNRRIAEISGMSLILEGEKISETAVPLGSEIVIHNSYNNEITGLKALFKDDASELYGLDLEKNSWARPFNFMTDDNISELDIQTFIDTIEEKSGTKPNMILCSFGVRRKLQKLFSENQTRLESVNLNGGYSTVSFNGIPIVVDRCCPKNCMYLLNTDDFCLHQLCDWQWLSDDDGRVLKQIPGKPVYTATLVKYVELMCSRPGAQAVITGVPEL